MQKQIAFIIMIAAAIAIMVSGCASKNLAYNPYYKIGYDVMGSSSDTIKIVKKTRTCKQKCNQDKFQAIELGEEQVAADAFIAKDQNISESALMTFEEKEFMKVYFAYDSYRLRASEAKAVKTNLDKLINDENLNVVIEGHGDERGSNEYNLALGEKRAYSLYRSLVKRGVNPERIKVISYGEEKPEIRGKGETIWAQNRRAVVIEDGSKEYALNPTNNVQSTL
ncbi:MAG: OmpA family protein [Pseudomonadota bacterium]